MDPEELDFLAQKYNVQAFNLHSTKNWPLIHDYGKYVSKIYIENVETVPSEDELKKFGGLCIDFAHWKEKQLCGNSAYCVSLEDRIKKYKIGCAHISAIKSELTLTVINTGKMKYDSHILKDLRELDYMKEYRKYLPNIISIELENSMSEQLKAKKYLEKIINSKEDE